MVKFFSDHASGLKEQGNLQLSSEPAEFEGLESTRWNCAENRECVVLPNRRES